MGVNTRWVLERPHNLWSCSRISHLRSGASPYLYATASTQWFIDILFITRDSRTSNKLCGRKTTKQNDFTLWNHSWLLSFRLTPCVVGFEKAETTSTSRNVRRTFHVPSGVRVQRSISGRDVSHPRVEPLIAFSHILELNSGSQDWRPLPDMSARLVSSPLRHISPVFQSWAFALVSLLERSLAFVFVS